MSLLLLLLFLVLIFYWFWINHWSINARIKNALKDRIFSYSTTAMLDNYSINKNAGGFFQVYADVIMHDSKNNILELHHIEATYSKNKWISWSFKAAPISNQHLHK